MIDNECLVTKELRLHSSYRVSFGTTALANCIVSEVPRTMLTTYLLLSLTMRRRVPTAFKVRPHAGGTVAQLYGLLLGAGQLLGKP